MSGSLSRRDFFSRFIPRSSETAVVTEEPVAGPQVAIIQGRHCLAYQNNFCSTCKERCPVPGAITSQHGIPRVVTELCTGCGVCHQLCPAPTNAILLYPKQQPHTCV
ncbi:4Fe-4S binding protein [Coraliomargarita akajimensis]|uniref:4Fe-4S ferredoxin iron-sulfur binding domain protein n=1 Tax=Coraliomargarita akajimensis (strain DSM 45221 / IAM 15411 / JCM 23193 / KCTC 12865 / 04OKA010-24) TaxID=583355 RepID=D5EKY9_CORAD|nr:4Fe-4S ferredoxin iron-sulfur binding domain protein [Coraliomargarita akajimensis DSM 45221]